MILYINETDAPNAADCNIPSNVIRYVVSKAEQYSTRCAQLHERYRGKPQLPEPEEDSDAVRAEANYAKYIVDITKGYYLSEPIKYDNNDTREKQAQTGIDLVSSVEAKLDKKTGKLVRRDVPTLPEKKIDISPIVDCYHAQNIAKIDDKNGKNIGIYGESMELLYASTDQVPVPRSAVYPPDQLILVQDNTVEHRDLFALWYEKRERLDASKYYAVSVYSATARQDYESTDCSKENFQYYPAGELVRHSFGAVPVVPYENNDERQGDFEQVAGLIDTRNGLLSDRLTDKRNFVNAVLAFYGGILSDDARQDMKKDKLIDGLPTDSKLEYIQKTFDEAGLKILDDTLVADIHKMTLTPDMTDEQFAGNSSGVALKLKLLALNLLVKNKMTAMEEGLKKRWMLYNNWLSNAQRITPVSIDDVDIVFTICMPIDEQAIVNMVCALKNAGLVDDQTLLSLLWFVKDPAEALENMKQQKQEDAKQYADSFANRESAAAGSPDENVNE